MKHHHIKANNNEWIHVHRTSAPGYYPASSGFDWIWVLKIVGWLAVFYIFMKLLPILLLAAGIGVALKFLSRM